jgi:hypothetical protein
VPKRSSWRILHPALPAAGLERAGAFDTQVVGKLMRARSADSYRQVFGRHSRNAVIVKLPFEDATGEVGGTWGRSPVSVHG